MLNRIAKRLAERRIQKGLKALAQLDLSRVKRKIMEPAPEGKGWSLAQANEAEKWYRHYLEVCLRFPKFPAVPNGPIDMMWHQHILDTRAYGRDCQRIFGRFLHHYPYYGMNGDADARDDSFDDTNAYYLQLFGEDCIHMQHFGGVKAKDCMIGGSCGQGCTDVAKAAFCEGGGGGTDCSVGCGGEMKALIPKKAMNCNSEGSGTGCGQGCSRGGKAPVKAAACTGGGSGTGCSQGCGRGR